MSKRSVLGLSLGLILAVGPLAVQADEPAAKEKVAPGKGKRAQEFLAAFERGDAKAVAAFWAPDGEYVNPEGRHYKGRSAIEKLYEKVFADRKGARLTIIVASDRQVTPDVKLEEGLTEVSSPEGGPPSVAAFSAVLVKQDGQWYFERVRESIAHPPSNAEHFEDIDWLIGDWAGESDKKGESATASYSWADNKNFIVSTFATRLGGIPVIGGTQWIAWDAVDKQIRSFTFYSKGGFGEAVWTQDGGKWLIKITARSADGKKLSATNVLARLDADHATWQVTGLTVDGKRLPDFPPMKLKRVKPERP
jgi:uncharacterized protein (TIGR02246 family)